MKRRDTIIIAVLINAGLLLILFATAISTNKDEETHTVTSATQIATAEEQPPLQRENAPTVPADEVDQVLSQWNTKPAGTSPGSQNQSAPNQVTLTYQSEKAEKASDPENEIDEDSEDNGDDDCREAPSTENSKKTYKVKKGDVLEKIAKKNGTTVQEIMRVNHLTSTSLKVGQILKMPGKASATAASKSASSKKEASSSSSNPQYYTVKSGDNPWLIAKKNHLALDELLRLNDLNEDKARRLQPGDKIRIR